MTIDFSIARKNMLESQVRTNDVSDRDLIDAIASVGRENFVEGDNSFAYAEIELPTKSGRTLMKARDLAKLAQAAEILGGKEVLVIAGAGLYSAKIFAEVGAKVTIIDSVTADNIDALLDGVEFVQGDIKALDALNGKKFDVVFVDGAVEYIPDAWFAAVAEGGRLALFKFDAGRSSGLVYVNTNGVHSYRSYFEANPPKLPELVTNKEFVF